MNTPLPGKLIVIDGTDGSGKGTQVDLLIKRLVSEGHQVKTADFPRYGEDSSYFVRRYLKGEYGNLESVNSRRASIFYALDRYEASFEIRNWLSQGIHVVANRYASANMGHQTAQVSEDKRDEFLAWLDELEFGIMGIPRPDVTILLSMRPDIGQQLVDSKKAETKVAIAGGKGRDLLEENLPHLLRAFDAYHYVARKYNWPIITCDRDNQPRLIEEIHQEVYSLVASKLN